MLGLSGVSCSELGTNETDAIASGLVAVVDSDGGSDDDAGETSYYRTDTVWGYGDAKAFCESKGDTLVIIQSDAENQAAYDACGEETYCCWLGLEQDTNDLSWTWVDGSPLTYSSWDGAEGTYGWENFAFMCPGRGYGTAWHDVGDYGDGQTYGLCQTTAVVRRLQRGNESLTPPPTPFPSSKAQPKPVVTVGQCADTSRRLAVEAAENKVLVSTDRRRSPIARRLSGDEAALAMTITALAHTVASDDSASFASEVSASVSAAVSSGALASSIASAAESAGITSLASLSVTSVTVDTHTSTALPLSAPTTVPLPAPTAVPWIYVGCFADSSSRDLSYFAGYQRRSDRSTML